MVTTPARGGAYEYEYSNILEMVSDDWLTRATIFLLPLAWEQRKGQALAIGAEFKKMLKNRRRLGLSLRCQGRHWCTPGYAHGVQGSHDSPIQP